MASSEQIQKFIIVGASGVGKTCILKRLVEGTFREDGPSTIGVEFNAATITVADSSSPTGTTNLKLQIWDTAGQERFRSIAKAYFRSAVGVLLVFDVAERRSFDEVERWLTDVRALCDPNAVVMLVGNKTDKENRQVTLVEAEAFATVHSLSYIETSALNGANIVEAFTSVATTIYRRGRGADKGGAQKGMPLIKREKAAKCC